MCKKIMLLSRYRLGRLIRITSGHNRLGYHQFVINSNLPRMCRYCVEVDETFANWADGCPVFDVDRQDVFGGLSGVFLDMWWIRMMLNFADIPRIKAALSHYVPDENNDMIDIDSDSNAPN